MKVGSEVGAYRVLSQIGQGGMGTVWLAEHAMLGRKAAIKLLHPMYSAQADVVKRFFNEARAATAISDPGIVQIFDFGQYGDTAYIAMELLDGEPLNRRLKRLGKLPIVDALRILRQIASSLAVAHAAGIVHRDLKPENVFLVRDPEVPGGERAKLLDFGIAKIADETGEHTQTSAVIGTPSYMSPEQCRGAGHVDYRSDFYAIGCLLFALVSGRPPFHSMGSGELIAMHLREPAPPLSSRAPGVSPELDALAARCLEKDPARRHSSSAELAGELGMMLSTMSGMAPTSGPPLRAPTAIPVAGPAAEAMPARAEPTFAAPSSSTVWSETQWPGAPAAAAPEMATTLSSSVHTASNPVAAAAMTRPGASRRTVIISAVLVLAVGGGVLAGLSGGGGSGEEGGAGGEAPVVVAQDPRAPQSRPPAGVAPSPPALPDDPSAPALVEPMEPKEPMALLAGQMQNVLRSFVPWAQGHAGEPCPTLDTLGSTETDPWGGKLVVTCTEQPGSQMIGVISMGPDGELGSRDDVGSWQLSREVTDIAHGARWTPASSKPVAKPVTKPFNDAVTAPPGNKPAKPVRKKPPISSDIPSER